MLRYSTGGESHGRALVASLEGIPAGLSLSCRDIDGELKRRQLGYGRSERMKIEKDRDEILSFACRWAARIHGATHRCKGTCEPKAAHVS